MAADAGELLSKPVNALSTICAARLPFHSTHIAHLELSSNVSLPQLAHLDINLAVVASEAKLAVAEVTSHSVHTGSVVQARVGEAVVHVRLASTAGESRRAGAVVVGDPIQASASIEARLVPTFIPDSLFITNIFV